MTPPLPTDGQIRQHCSDAVFTRGQQYARQQSVHGITLRGSQLTAHVEGSEVEPYTVTVDFDTGGLLQARCTCPYEGGGWCKHIVATLLIARADPQAIIVRPPLAELLANRSREQLVTLIQQLAAAHAEVVPLIDRFTSAAPATGAAGRRTPPDATMFRREVEYAFRGVQQDDYYAGDKIAEKLQPLLDRIAGFINANEAAGALGLLDVFSDVVVHRWVEYDNIEDNITPIFDTLASLWADALLSANLSPADRLAYTTKLELWNGEINDYALDTGFEVALLAAEQEWQDIAVQAMLRGETVELDADTYAEQELLDVRLRVLERQGKTDEYLRFAAAAKRYNSQALMLARLGRVQEAVDAVQHLTTANDALAVAAALRERGNTNEALAVARHGLTLKEPRTALGSWLAEYAAGLGNHTTAVTALETAFISEPTLARYQRLRAFDEVGWAARRDRLLTIVRRSGSNWPHRSERIDILLHEQQIDDAITLVQGDYGSPDLARVMEAALGTHTDWVVKTATQHAEAIMDDGDAQHYENAVNWLRYARQALRASNRLVGWKAYMDGIRAKHGRKYKLMGMLDLLESERR